MGLGILDQFKHTKHKNPYTYYLKVNTCGIYHTTYFPRDVSVDILSALQVIEQKTPLVFKFITLTICVHNMTLSVNTTF